VQQLLREPAADRTDADFANGSRHQFDQAISTIAEGFQHLSPESKQWIFGFIMPAIQIRECKADLDRHRKSGKTYGHTRLSNNSGLERICDRRWT
jgi:hypothetical protein